jgi:hypothetical protein
MVVGASPPGTGTGTGTAAGAGPSSAIDAAEMGIVPWTKGLCCSTVLREEAFLRVLTCWTRSSVRI